MRCSCCNKNLSDYESTIRHAETNEFLDTCLSCLDDLGIPFVGREDLSNTLEDQDDSQESY